MSDRHPLAAYRDKRRFDRTPEPDAELAEGTDRSFVIQKHWASHLHYDFRLELEGTMKSWAVPKGPSLDPQVKRMAVQVEDHPVAYNSFEGEIPAKQYGAGKVIIWDSGTWEPVGDPGAGYRNGNLKFRLAGHKLQGKWALIRMQGKGEKQPPWLLIKEKDGFVRKAGEYDVLEALPDSVIAEPVRSAAKQISPPAESPVVTTADRMHTRSKQLAVPAGSVACALPATLTPQLATLVEALPADATAWRYEIKFDGYRLLARIEGNRVKLFTRNGKDWSAKMPELVRALRALNFESAWLDGEIVVLDAAGLPDFQSLQAAFDGAASQAIVYYLFDLPFHAGRDLRRMPLHERQRLLGQALQGKLSDPIRLSEGFDQAAGDLLASACKLGLEGVIGKRLSSPYSGRRSADWIKVKCQQRQEFVVVGYTPAAGARTGFGALLLGVHDADGVLRFAGKVGTGFDDRALHQIGLQLARLAATKPAITAPSGTERNVRWVEPTLVAEVSFAAWTSGGRLRHAVFRALRNDKPAAEIVRERSAAVIEARPAISTTSASVTLKPSATAMTDRLRITHPAKVIDVSTGLTKRDLADHYAKVGLLMMPHLVNRPVALVRAPEGIGGSLFFQKHADQKAMHGIVLLDPTLDPGHAPLLAVGEPVGLLSAAQMNVIEFHTWNGRTEDLTLPDRMAFDLDPGEGVDWPVVQESAVLLNALLKQLGLYAFLKTSGGKGLHLVVPLVREYDWATVKAFSQAVVAHLARTLPQRFVARSGPANRIGKVYVDYLRNGFGATTVSAWSARARPGLGVSVPIRWDELARVSGGAHWSLQNIDGRIDAGNAAWTGYDQSLQGLDAAMEMLGFDATRGRK